MNSKPPKILYHYTSRAGLIGIVESRSLWASDLMFLNDSGELAKAIDLIGPALEVSTALSVDPAHLADLLTAALDPVLTKTVTIAAASFSKDGNLLSQWRAYCPANGGYALGFAAEVLVEVGREQGYALRACAYEANDQISLVREAVEPVLDLYKRGMPNDETAESIKELFLSRYLEIAPLVKDQSFSAEYEWRLIRTEKAHDQDWKVRDGLSTLVPHLTVELSDRLQDALCEVAVGPTPHPDLALRGAERLLKAKGLFAVVSPLEVTARSW